MFVSQRWKGRGQASLMSRLKASSNLSSQLGRPGVLGWYPGVVRSKDACNLSTVTKIIAPNKTKQCWPSRLNEVRQ